MIPDRKGELLVKLDSAYETNGDSAVRALLTLENMKLLLTGEKEPALEDFARILMQFLNQMYNPVRIAKAIGYRVPLTKEQIEICTLIGKRMTELS